MAIAYNALPPTVQLRVGSHPDVTVNWCGYTVNNYTIDAFVKGIFRDEHMNAVTNLKANVSQPYLAAFLEDDAEAYLGDGFRHIESGEVFPEEYVDIDREGESLAPISGHHLNIITETDRTIEKWHVRLGHNREDFAKYFKDFSTFQQFMEILKGNMMKGIKKSLGIIVKAVMTSDPTRVSFDDKDMARIFGRAWDFTNVVPPKTPNSPVLPNSKLGQKWAVMMQQLVNKYSSKARELWKNITLYNPYNFAWNGSSYEEMDYSSVYMVAGGAKSDVEKALARQQNLYTDTHKLDSAEESESDNFKTRRIVDLHRNDCLFALVDAISKALLILTTEESAEFWLGYPTEQKVFMGDPEKYKKWHEEMLRSGSSVEGFPLPLPEGMKQLKNYDSPHSYSSADGFEVCATPNDLILLMNPEDYMDLEIGIARRGQMDTRAVNLDMLRKYCSNIYPMRGMKAGFARLIDKRAFRIRSYFQMTDVQTPMERLTWRYKTFFLFATTMFKNFAGTLFVPTPHFVASPRFYDKYGLIGKKAVDPLKQVGQE